MTIPTCPACHRPTHASESNDAGVCAECLGADAILPDAGGDSHLFAERQAFVDEQNARESDDDDEDEDTTHDVCVACGSTVEIATMRVAGVCDGRPERVCLECA